MVSNKIPKSTRMVKNNWAIDFEENMFLKHQKKDNNHVINLLDIVKNWSLNFNNQEV
jgi:hypothetical protein